MMRKCFSEVELEEIRSSKKDAENITNTFSKFLSRVFFINDRWIDSKVDKSKWRVCEINIEKHEIRLANKNAKGYKMRHVNLVIKARENSEHVYFRVYMYLGGHGSTPHLPKFSFTEDEITHAQHSVPSIMKQYENGYKVS